MKSLKERHLAKSNWLTFSSGKIAKIEVVSTKKLTKVENCQKWCGFEHRSKLVQMMPVSHIKLHFVQCSQKVYQKWKTAKSAFGSNVTQIDYKLSLRATYQVTF